MGLFCLLVDWSVKGKYIAVARENNLHIFSSKFKEKSRISLPLKLWIGDSDDKCSVKGTLLRGFCFQFQVCLTYCIVFLNLFIQFFPLICRNLGIYNASFRFFSLSNELPGHKFSYLHVWNGYMVFLYIYCLLFCHEISKMIEWVPQILDVYPDGLEGGGGHSLWSIILMY